MSWASVLPFPIGVYFHAKISYLSVRLGLFPVPRPLSLLHDVAYVYSCARLSHSFLWIFRISFH